MSERDIRVLTYNTHGCVGTDRVHDPARIAAVIAESGADIVALQELDVGRGRSGRIDQAAEIARALSMQYHFGAVREVDDGHYGNAIVSRWPIRMVRAAGLPDADRGHEKRGALWGAITLPGGTELQLITTHLGLDRAERKAQVEVLLADEWIARCPPPAIVCGDLNAHPWGRVCQRIGSCLRRARRKGFFPAGTFPSCWPILPIDHVFITPDLEVVDVQAIRTRRSRRASDHVPLAVTVRL